MDDVKLKAHSGEWPGHSRLEGISARIIMTHTQSIINLACIIRKHESGHVVKVLLVVPLSSLWPRRPSAIFFFFSSPLLVIYRKSTHLCGGTTPRILSLCPITVNNEERWKEEGNE